MNKSNKSKAEQRSKTASDHDTYGRNDACSEPLPETITGQQTPIKGSAPLITQNNVKNFNVKE